MTHAVPGFLCSFACSPPDVLLSHKTAVPQIRCGTACFTQVGAPCGFHQQREAQSTSHQLQEELLSSQQETDRLQGEIQLVLLQLDTHVR